MLTYRFNFPKAFQATAVVLREHRSQMDFVRLLKLLYIADRELLAEIGVKAHFDELLANAHCAVAGADGGIPGVDVRRL